MIRRVFLLQHNSVFLIHTSCITWLCIVTLQQEKFRSKLYLKSELPAPQMLLLCARIVTIEKYEMNKNIVPFPGSLGNNHIYATGNPLMGKESISQASLASYNQLQLLHLALTYVFMNVMNKGLEEFKNSHSTRGLTFIICFQLT